MSTDRATSKIDRPDVRFLVHVTKSTYSGGVFNVRLDAAYLTDANEVRSPLWSEYDPSNAAALDSFQINAQADADRESDPPRWYGYDAVFHQPYKVDLGRAKSMAKVLSRVNSSIEKHRAQFGYETSFSQFAVVVAKAIGVRYPAQAFGIKTDNAHDFNGTGYRWTNADGLAHYMSECLSGKQDVIPTRY